MREIKFRGYNKITKEWYFGYLNKFDNLYFINDGTGTMPFVEEESIGQYTGFKDSKGNKIYEGDILEIENDCEVNHLEVYYYEPMGIWGAYDEFVGYDVDLYEVLKDGKSKIINNIYNENLNFGLYEE